MAEKLDGPYHLPGFPEMDHMTLLAELLVNEYQEKSAIHFTEKLEDKCIDSAER